MNFCPSSDMREVFNPDDYSFMPRINHRMVWYLSFMAEEYRGRCLNGLGRVPVIGEVSYGCGLVMEME